jgi:asperthecin polyketide synthase
MALTVGEHLYKMLLPKTKEVHMNVSDMEVLHAQVAQSDKSCAQLLMLEANIDLAAQAMIVHWYNVSVDGTRSENSFASATVLFEDPAAWQSEWERVEHFVKGRIEALSRMAVDGTANKLSKNMTYNLFKNVVDYTDKYRGMQSVVLDEHEAFADISLVPETHGTWHTPPHWIDSVFHLAGFIMNGSDASNTKDFFYVTPGWDSSRLAKPLKPDAPYRSYVRMFPSKEPNMYAGDVYLLQNDVVVGMMGQIKFRRVPRLLMSQFFSPPDVKKSNGGSNPQHVTPTHPAVSTTPKTVTVNSEEIVQKLNTKAQTVHASAQSQKTPEIAVASKPVVTQENSVIADCLRLIARETGLDPDELTDDASFVELGVDSLMSLVLSEKFRTEMQLEIKSSLFLEYSRIGELKGWLEQYC